MSTRRVIVFRSRLREGIDAEYGVRGEEIYQLAIRMPGFVSIKDFVAEDGERVAIAEFDSPEHLEAWRTHAEHAKAQQEGRDRYYTEYRVQVCELLRESRFDAATNTWIKEE